ncbi:MAG: alpha-ketoglutarate-dependent dioxygenase AlkB [Salinimicrobium sp.]
MNLFPEENLLPREGEVLYFGKIMSAAEADHHFQQLLETSEWQQDEVIIFGKRIVTKRETAWYGEEEFEYTYSKITRKAKLWTPQLLELKQLVERETGLEFNSCLLNLYHSGEEGMSWHADAEAELGKQPAIASVSLGAERKFMLKHKASGEKVSLQLENGSLLLMQGETQRYWLHSLPKTKKVQAPRINLTFRNIKKWNNR